MNNKINKLNIKSHRIVHIRTQLTRYKYNGLDIKCPCIILLNFTYYSSGRLCEKVVTIF